MFKRVLLLSCASGAIGLVATGAQAATATASSTAAASAASTSSVTELVVTAEKREQALQHVAIAITAFTAAKRDEMGINSIQDMTNFTPGLTYSTSTDRITLRGVGRTTNVLSADAPVANYDDGLYETFAVAAGRSSLELAQVVVDRGPAGHAGRAQRPGRLARRGHPEADLDAAGRVPLDVWQLRPHDRRGGGLRPDQRSVAIPALWQLGVPGPGLDQQRRPGPGVRGQQHQRVVRRCADPGALQRPPRHVDEVPVGWLVQRERRSRRPVGRLDEAGQLPELRVLGGGRRAERRLRLRARLPGRRASSTSRL